MTVREEQARFFGKLAALMQAGIPLLKAFEVGIESVADPGLEGALGRILRRAYSGTSLSDSFSEEREHFSTDVLCLLEVGEEMGDLDLKAAAISKGLSDGHFIVPPAPEAGAAGAPALLGGLLDRGLAEGVTEIHVEPWARGYRVRHRTGDGPLAVVETLTAGDADRLFAETWEAAGIAAGRHHGDFFHGERLVVASHCPFDDGPGLVLVLTSPAEQPATLEEAGMDESQAATVGEWLEAGTGLIAVTGPLYSRTSRTLGAMLRVLDPEKQKILVSAAPAGFYVPGVHRWTPEPGAYPGAPERVYVGVRQRPDVLVFFDEIFGPAAEIALDLAGGGTLVVACFRARSAPEALLDLGRKGTAGLVFEAVRGIVCQRSLPRADGQGRVPVFEVLPVTEKVRETYREGAVPVKLRAAAESAGMVPMQEAAERLVEEGIADREVVRRAFGWEG